MKRITMGDVIMILAGFLVTLLTIDLCSRSFSRIAANEQRAVIEQTKTPEISDVCASYYVWLASANKQGIKSVPEMDTNCGKGVY